MPRTNPLSPSVNQLTDIPATPEAPPPSIEKNSGPKMVVPEEKPLTGWGDLPTDVLVVLFNQLLHEAQSVLQAPTARFEALQTIYQLSSVARLENSALDFVVKNQKIDLKLLEKDIRHALQEEWRNNATDMADNRDKLLQDFNVTREALRSFDASGIPPTLLGSCDGIHLKFSEISLSPALGKLISGLEGKTVKIDATGIGRDRFINEILPALEKLPKNCKVVLDATNNELTVADLGKLVQVMIRQPVIYRLDLSANPLSDGENHEPIARLFWHAGPLTHLYLEGTAFDNSMALVLKGAFSQAHFLQHLDLRNNLLDEHGVITLIKATLPDEVSDEKQLARLDELRTVRLGGNPFLDHAKVSAAASEWRDQLDGLRTKEYYQSLTGGKDVEYPASAPEIFEIYVPTADPMTVATVGMYDNRAAARRL